jgi:hypothetical protein
VTAADLSDIHLPGEEDETAPIFDTCDDVRKMINIHLKDTNTTPVAFAKELSPMLPRSKIETRQLRKFLSFKGPRAGAQHDLYHAGYVFFEKLRIEIGKKKSAKRQKIEEFWTKNGANGMPRENSHNMRLTCIAGETWRLD